MFPISDILNTDEIPLLLQSFPSQQVFFSKQITACKRVKNRLTSILAVYANNTNVPLTIIGKSKRPARSPKAFFPHQLLRVIYFHQYKFLHMQHLFPLQYKLINQFCKEHGLQLLHLTSNSFPHSIDCSADRNVNTHLLSPSTTSALQFMDSSIVKSF